MTQITGILKFIIVLIFQVHFDLSTFKSSYARENLFTPGCLYRYIYTFKVRELDAVVGPENMHRCRIHPCEAAIFSLRAKARNLEMFMSISRAELTVEVEEKKENSSVEIPVNFSKEDVARVKYYLFLQFCKLILIVKYIGCACFSECFPNFY